MKYIFLLVSFFPFLNAEVTILKTEECKINEISKEELKYLFLGSKTEIKKEKIKIFYSENESEQEEFYKSYLNKTPYQIKIYWTKLIYTGKKQPPEVINIKKEKIKEKTSCYLTFSSYKKDIEGWRELKIVSN